MALIFKLNCPKRSETKMTLIDLSMYLNEETPVYPGDPTPQFTKIAEKAEHGFSDHNLNFNTHFGTHIDSPWHMLEGAKKLKDFPITTFAGEAIVLDCRGQREITLDVTEVKSGDIVLLRTDHTKNIHEEDYFTANPIISFKLAERLVEKKVKMVGIDSFSPDNPPFQIHKLLLSNDILILENLVNLDKITKPRAKLYAFPLKLENDGAPVRAVAEV